jgi:hypothetical protein
MAEDDDVFNSFRQRLVNEKTTPAAPKLVVDHAGKHEGYEAFGSKDKLHRFDLRCHNGLAHLLAYNYLLNVTYDRRRYGAIFLTVSGLTVTIKGRALRPIVDALKLHTCEFIQAFDPEEFDEPTDPAAPYVQSIDVEVIKGAVPKAVDG